MKYQKYPAQTIKVAGGLRRAPATFENPVLPRMTGRTVYYKRPQRN